MPKAVITGVGAVTSLGTSAAETFSALLAGKRGLRKLTFFASPRYGHIPVGEVLGSLDRFAEVTMSRTERLGLVAAGEALAQAGLSPAQAERAGTDWGVIAGTTVAGMFSTEEYFRQLWAGKKPKLALVRQHLSGSVSKTLAQAFNFQGFSTTISTACTKGVNTSAGSGVTQPVLGGK